MQQGKMMLLTVGGLPPSLPSPPSDGLRSQIVWWTQYIAVIFDRNPTSLLTTQAIQRLEEFLEQPENRNVEDLSNMLATVGFPLKYGVEHQAKRLLQATSEDEDARKKLVIGRCYQCGEQGHIVRPATLTICFTIK